MFDSKRRSTAVAAPARSLRLALSLALAAGLTLVVAGGSPASAAVDCTSSKAAVTKATTRLAEGRERRVVVAKRLRADHRRVNRLERRVAHHRTPAKVRALRAARADVRTDRARLKTIDKRLAVVRGNVKTARVAHGLCVNQGASEAELFDILDMLGLTPLLEMIGLPQLLVSLGVVDLLEMLGLADILVDLGLGSLIGR